MTIIYPAAILPYDFKKARIRAKRNPAGIAGIGLRRFTV
jgi:hypothetical protein